MFLKKNIFNIAFCLYLNNTIDIDFFSFRNEVLIYFTKKFSIKTILSLCKLRGTNSQYSETHWQNPSQEKVQT